MGKVSKTVDYPGCDMLYFHYHSIHRRVYVQMKNGFRIWMSGTRLIGRRRTMRSQKRTLLVLLIALLCLVLIPAHAFAEETKTDPSDQNGSIAVQVQGESIRGDKLDLADSDTLFAQYVNRQLKSSARSQLKMSVVAGNGLTGANAAIYAQLSSQIAKVADGKESSTEFIVTGLSWTAAELGLATIYDGTGISDAARQAVAEQIDLDLLLTALTADHPYDLYWYDKTKYTSSSYSYSNSGETLTITSLKYSFPVLAEYAVAGQSYAVDTSIPQAVQTAKTTAQNIVNKYAGKTDREKLNGYRKEICDRVRYNDAALSDDYSNGNPWQLIWVFDEDSSTDVVCEGYSKAFQYLCDLTTFSSSQIQCITVTGGMDGGAHMWNVVRMEDGKNYLADVTNCDGSSVGAPDKLFLAKCTEGSVTKGYTFNCNPFNVRYQYDGSTTRLYGESALAIANVDASLDPTPDTAAPTPTPTATPTAAQDAAPDPGTTSTDALTFSTTTLDGKAYSSDVIQNYDLVVLNFWGEWCPPCVWELPYLQQISENYKNVLILGAWYGNSEEEALQTAQEAGVTYPLLHPTGMLEDYLWASNSFPHTFFFDSNGNQVGDIDIGAKDYSRWESTIQERLAMLSQGGAAQPTATPTPTATPAPVEASATVKRVQAKKSLKLQAPKAKGNAYQWYVRTSKNAPWQSLGKKGAKDKLSVKATMAMDGYQYRCEIRSASGVRYTDTYELYVYEQLKVKKQPKWGKKVLPGAKMTLTITAQGASSYQWVTRPNGSSPWTKIEGATGTSYVVDVQEGMAGRQYACQISGKAGTAQSKAVVVKIAPWPKVKFSKQPVLKKPVVPGSWVTLTVKAANADTYQWYYRTSAKGAWILYSGATQPNLTFQVQAGTNGYQYKCTARGRGGTVDSKPVTLKVVTP